MSICFGDSIIGTSGINGDMFYISPDNTTLLLSDGASGAGSEGKVVMSKCCARNIEENPFCSSGLSPKAYLEKMIWKINNDLIGISQKSKTYTFGTLVICVIHNNKATFMSVGDSPAYFIHNNIIKRVARTKKTYQNLIEMGLFTEEQAEEYIHQLPEHMWSMFDRFIPMVVPVYSIEEIEIESGDIVVICCDGVSDYLKPEEINQLIRPDKLVDSVNAIINIAKSNSITEQNKYDDITIVLYCH
jgi:Serine/threonine protein phosphatase